jgi:hypothetical protein
VTAKTRAERYAEAEVGRLVVENLACWCRALKSSLTEKSSGPRTAFVRCVGCGRSAEIAKPRVGQRLRCGGCGAVHVFREAEAKASRRRWKTEAL